ncbi:hypothetical protein [Nonomuraea dietziae]|uniref:hypothetical protein n=1 Tax=Nonomuraea dietziae TaxID=65515 RepID=UPI0034399138
MLSLDNVFGAEQLAEWAASVERRIGRPAGVEPKLDGLAIAARYLHARGPVLKPPTAHPGVRTNPTEGR